MNVVPPLEASPRVATSGPGDDRDGGARRHRGLDVVASPGEPIRAIADGTVIFAGANMRGSARTIVSPAKSARYARKRLGAGGVYMCIRHRGIVSAQAADGGGDGAMSPAKRRPSRRRRKPRAWSPATCTSTASSWRTGAEGEGGRHHRAWSAARACGDRRPTCTSRCGSTIASSDPWRYFADSIMPPNATVTHRYNGCKQKSRLRAIARAQRAAKPPPRPRSSPPGSRQRSSESRSEAQAAILNIRCASGKSG